MFYGFDIYYFILILPALLFGLWAQSQVNTNFQKYSRIGTMRGMTGAQAAEYILQKNGIYNVSINQISGHLSDHFNPKTNAINLSESVYNSTSIAAIGVAAHEAGHAVQHAVDYKPIRIREMVIPVTQIGSWLYLPILLVGVFLSSQGLINIGILLFSSLAIFQLVTLPVEFDASDRAIKTLSQSGILQGEEITGAKRVLKAAALTYVAALVSSLAQLLRLILLFGGRRRD
jgi:Zn-dependent membrane protease YugP